MKKYILIVLICFMHSYASAQYSNLKNIKDYYHSIDKEKLIDSLVKRINKQEQQSHDTLVSWGLNFPADSMWIVKREQNLENIRNKNSVILLVPKFKNARNYSFDKNIYDFLSIDTSETEIRYFNTQKGEVTILNTTKFERYSYIGKELKYLIKLQEIIKKENYKALLLGKWFLPNFKEGNTNYLFLKEDKICVYRSKYKDMYELNQFVRKFFKEKEFIEHTILNEQGLILVR